MPENSARNLTTFLCVRFCVWLSSVCRARILSATEIATETETTPKAHTRTANQKLH